MRLGFHNEVFAATGSAYPLAAKVTKDLIGKVLENDKKFIGLAYMKKYCFSDTEFKIIGQFGNRNQTEDEEDDTFRGKNVHLFTSLRQETPDICAAEDIWELFLTLDCLMQSGVRSISLNYFYQIGQRQHKKRPHESFTAALALRLAQTAAGGAHILTHVRIIHPHNETSPGFLQGTKVDDLLPIAPAVLYFKSNPETNRRKIVIVATDGGSETFNRYLAQNLGAKGPIIMNKDRDENGDPTSFISAGHQYIRKDAIYIAGDDIISSGETLENAKRDIERIVGHKIEFYAYTTNGCFNTKNEIPAPERIRKAGIKVLSSDTIHRSDAYLKENEDWLSVYTIAPFISDAIICDVLQKSTREIFKRHIDNAQRLQPDINELLLNNKIPVLC